MNLVSPGQEWQRWTWKEKGTEYKEGEEERENAYVQGPTFYAMPLARSQ